MYLIGATYNFCFPHQQLSKKVHFGCSTTPAMAVALTDHLWSMRELLIYKKAPPEWEEHKKRKDTRKASVTDSTIPKRTRG